MARTRSTTAVKAALRERVKELTCLYGMAQHSADPARTLDAVLDNIARSLPAAWRFPGAARGRIELDGRRFESSDFDACAVTQEAAIRIRGRLRGRVCVGYRPGGRTGRIRAFLPEEQRLLDEAARQLSLIVERREVQAEQEAIRARLHQADRLATIGQMASGMAHELNEPLGSILGFAQLIGKTKRLPPQARADLRKIEAAALHARDIIRKLMLFARGGSGCRARVDLNRLIEEAASLWTIRGEEEHVRTVCELDPAQPAIWADPGQMKQVLVNLAVNAIQAMPDGGTLRIATRRDGAWTEMTVSDSGGGIPEATKPRLFDPFFTTKEVNEGVGLGLSVVHGIVAGHGGTIGVERSPAGGALFRVRLSADGPAAQEAP